MPRLEFPRFAVPVLLALAVGVAGCGGSDDAEQADATVPTQAQQRRAPEITVPTTPQTTPTTPVQTTPQTTPVEPPQTTATQQTPPQTTPAQPPQTGGATTPRRATSPQQTGGATGPTACGDVANGFISGVQASGAGCGEATSVANEWLGAVGESGPEADVVAGGYACSGSRAGDATSITCIADGGRRVTFSANN
ncbi:hypothetical protein [Conexibacter arvalis]|uniref:Outer membrane biosynthesis protein TonB n=1 Tax=Conexibacter arvalis TaxID=912552 RepID=A0A840IM75_9ACTN|nr:hypothetical protein [Conexibacter arvalis]MBB4665253.1 outer membrane biosynthesis protein TonB [Conexibacter arvalis]